MSAAFLLEEDGVVEIAMQSNSARHSPTIEQIHLQGDNRGGTEADWHDWVELRHEVELDLGDLGRDKEQWDCA